MPQVEADLALMKKLLSKYDQESWEERGNGRVGCCSWWGLSSGWLGTFRCAILEVEVHDVDVCGYCDRS